MPDQFPDQPEVAEADPSKSALKRQMTALQQLGESLINLADAELAKISIDDQRLLQAIDEAKRIKSKNARRRHLQFIGKLMRDIDAGPIEAALQQLRQPKRQQVDEFHQLEQLRASVLTAGLAGVETVMAQFPHADRQHLRQLILQHGKEVAKHRPPAASRKLFKYLRELQSTQG